MRVQLYRQRESPALYIALCVLMARPGPDSFYTFTYIRIPIPALSSYMDIDIYICTSVSAICAFYANIYANACILQIRANICITPIYASACLCFL